MSKKDHVAAALKKLQSPFGDKVRLLSDDPLRDSQQAIPTGIDVIDHYLVPIGGFPCGSRGITEMYSEEGGGKSSLLYSLVATAQAGGVPVFLADTEYSLDADRAQAFGVDTERLIALEPDHMEEAFQMFEATLDALPGGDLRAIIAWDSLAATATKGEVEAGVAADKSFDTRAKLISSSLRVLNKKCAEKNAAFVVINQPRTKIGVMFGDPTTTPGGQALKSTASLRLQMWPGKHIEVNGEKTGRYITIGTKKTRFSPPRKVRVRLDFDGGFNNEWSTLELAKELGMVGPREKGAKGLEKAYAALAARFPGFGTVTRDAAKAEALADEPEASE